VVVDHVGFLHQLLRFSVAEELLTRDERADVVTSDNARGDHSGITLALCVSRWHEEVALPHVTSGIFGLSGIIIVSNSNLLAMGIIEHLESTSDLLISD